ncbi:hypothetical protein [Candidatus Clostridium radicumherbarum]|uniref:Uncharacterized protein n=1 Tax=Candidatus Clostridium radicumherbarum TaxID=3381662 RepID=A0ABW8TM64_9CLOT
MIKDEKNYFNYFFNISTFRANWMLKSTKIKDANVKQPSNVTDKKQDVREVVWNQLNAQEKEHIKGTWNDFKVSKITLTENMGRISDKSYIGKEVYLIDFTIDSMAIPNNRIVYASLDDYKLIGYGLVD